jgi:hypothetical protein
MSLDYDKIRREAESPQTSMRSYSDLFAALAFVFLFLYVLSSLQLSLQAISSRLEAQKLEAKLEAYELPPDAQAQASEAEQQEVRKILPASPGVTGIRARTHQQLSDGG